MVVHLKTVFRLFTCIWFHSCTPLYSIKMLFFFISSPENFANLQHWNEVQDEGPHHDGWCHILEVDLGEHDCFGDRDHGVSLVHGRGLPTYQDFWQTFQPLRLSGMLSLLYFLVFFLEVWSQNYWKLNLSASSFWLPPHWKLEIMIQVQIYHSFR